MFRQVIPFVSSFSENENQMKLAKTFFEVQKMLGRDFKRYNLLVSSGTGDWFSSSNNSSDLMEYIQNQQLRSQVLDVAWGNFNNGYDYDLTYSLLSSYSYDKHKNDKQFFMYINLSGEDQTHLNMSIPYHRWLSWNE